MFACLTAGVDVMKDHLIVGIYGWDHDDKPTEVRRIDLRDDNPNRNIWFRLQDELSGYTPCPDGWQSKIAATCIDTVAHRAQETYSFVRTTKLSRTYAVKLVNSGRQGAWPKKPSTEVTSSGLGPVTNVYMVSISPILGKLARVSGIDHPSDDLVLAAAARESLLAERTELARGQLDENGDGDVRTAELARGLEKHLVLPEGTLHLTEGSDIAGERVEFEIANWDTEKTACWKRLLARLPDLQFYHTTTITIGRWQLATSLCTAHQMRPFVDREERPGRCTTWRAGALGFEIELERYAS